MAKESIIIYFFTFSFKRKRKNVRFNKVNRKKVKGFRGQESGVARQPFMAIMTSSCVSPVLRTPQ
jgi:hypothetical protein